MFCAVKAGADDGSLDCLKIENGFGTFGGLISARMSRRYAASSVLGLGARGRFEAFELPGLEGREIKGKRGAEEPNGELLERWVGITDRFTLVSCAWSFSLTSPSDVDSLSGWGRGGAGPLSVSGVTGIEPGGCNGLCSSAGFDGVVDGVPFLSFRSFLGRLVRPTETLIRLLIFAQLSSLSFFSFPLALSGALMVT